MRIRKYQQKDQVQVVRLIARVLKEFGYTYSRVLDRDLLRIPEYYLRRGGCFWVLTVDDRVVGTIAVSRISARVCKLRRFYISRKYRHKGWGLMLYRKAMKFIKTVGYREVWTSTTAKFKDSIRFQERAGFKRTKRVLWPYRRAGIFHILKVK